VAPHPIVFWFRRDLRLADNPALVAAVRRSDGHVAAVFVVDRDFAAPAGAARIDYLRRTLEALDVSLAGCLSVRVGDPAVVLVEVAREIGAREVFATGDFGPRGRERDHRVAEALSVEGLTLRLVDSPYVVEPGTVLTTSSMPCRVFGSFRRGWELLPVATPVDAPSGVHWHHLPSSSLDELTRCAGTSRPWYFGDLPDGPPSRPSPAGENAAREVLTKYRDLVDHYDEVRDHPGLDQTSRLSPHLRFGALHPRQVLATLDGDSTGRRTFRSEICWREFYADVVFHRPDSVRHVMQPTLEHLRVDDDERAVARFQTWARGETGYPLVDAGMRQLLSEGWVHNRVRMVAASFLVKHLHLDWRWGARWFMWRLVDGDIASNQHGWQWTAGTSTDAAPFHRIFNPTLQAQRFDTRGTYIRRHVGELASVPAPQCLEPGGGARGLGSAYASPMVDHGTERAEALARFAEARALARIGS